VSMLVTLRLWVPPRLSPVYPVAGGVFLWRCCAGLCACLGVLFWGPVYPTGLNCGGVRGARSGAGVIALWPGAYCLIRQTRGARRWGAGVFLPRKTKPPGLGWLAGA
jgi:hypothetical protein